MIFLQRKNGIFRGLLLTFVATAVTSTANASCADLAREALAQGKTPSTHVASLASEATPGTPRALDLRRCQVRLLFREWQIGRTDEAAPPGEADIPVLEAMFQAFEFWQVHAALGDARSAAGAHEEAARRYGLALATIDDQTLTPEEVDNAQIEALFQKAQQANLLARHHVPSPVPRSDGSGAGIMALGIRSYAVSAVALPIRFDFDSAILTDDGRASADELFETLKRQQPGRIVLAGHTDQTGDAGYNRALSRRRAEALRDYLRSRGLPEPTEGYHLLGLGEDCPFRFSDTSTRSQEEIDRANRRVQYLRRMPPADGGCP
jgi:outer membrane protein OmpA-like peptidoglycan-associated protein